MTTFGPLNEVPQSVFISYFLGREISPSPEYEAPFPQSDKEMIGSDGHSTTEGQVTDGGHVTGGGGGGHVHSGVGGQVTTGGHVTGRGVGGDVTTGGYVTGEGVGRNVTSGACLVYTALCDEPNTASCTHVLR